MIQRWFFILGIGSLVSLSAEQPLFPEPEQARCAQSVLKENFDSDLITATLEEYKIDKSTQSKLLEQLKNKDSEIRKRFSKKQKDFAELLVDKEKRKIAVKRFQESVFEVFNEAAEKAGMTDKAINEKIFFSLQKKRLERLGKCLEERKEALESP